jgi:hypothetical protein
LSKPVIDNCGTKSCVRALRTAFVEEWLGREERGQEERADEPIIGQTRIAGREMPIRRFVGIPPSRDAGGEIEQMGLLAGQGSGLWPKYCRRPTSSAKLPTRLELSSRGAWANLRFEDHLSRPAQAGAAVVEGLRTE